MNALWGIICRAPYTSQLEEGVDGIIVPQDNEGCAEGIATLLLNVEKMNILGACCAKREYSNKEEIGKIYQLVR